MTDLVQYLLLGIFTGVMAGLLGIGGGLVVVPTLSALFLAKGFPPEQVIKIAIATSLTTIVVTSISSIRAHNKRNNVLWSVFWRFVPGTLIGSLLGAYIAHLLPSLVLRRFFATFLIVSAIQIAFSGENKSGHHALPRPLVITLIGIVIGALSALLGVGGGAMTVPFLLYCGVPPKNSVGTSAASGLPIAIAGVLGNLLTGTTVEGLPPGSTGYIYWPAFAGIASMSALTAPLGARLATRIQGITLKRIFAVFLVIEGIRMLLK